MPSIYTAIYRSENKEETVELLAINAKNYYAIYKNKLFCSEPNCFAKLCYVLIPGNSKRSYLRKWKYSPHSENCLHYTDEVKSETRTRRSGVAIAIATEEQISRSLKSGFELELMTDEEKEKKREEDRRTRENRTRRNIGNKKTEQLSLTELVANPEESATVANEAKGGRLLKRNIDDLKDKDLGKTRTIIGWFSSLEHTEERMIIRVVRNGTFLDIKFEEAFFASAPEYREMFHLIERFSKENDEIMILATGEVRRNEGKYEYSLGVFDKTGLSVHGKRLVDLAREYSLGHFNF